MYEYAEIVLWDEEVGEYLCLSESAQESHEN